METFLLSFLIVSLAALGMALGVLFGRPPLSAGCGRDTVEESGIGCGHCSRVRRCAGRSRAPVA